MDDNLDAKFWVALSTNHKIGARTLLKLYKRYGRLKTVWKANRSQLGLTGLDSGQIEAVFDVIKNTDPDKEMEKLAKLKIKVLIFPDKSYPKLLKEIADPPGVLYFRGNLDQEELVLAIVGSRKYSNYGKKVASEMAYKLASNGLTIVSGLALGIDSFAHEATLLAKGNTIAVLACGLDSIYPVSNIRLGDKMLANGGAIISEFPLGTPALNYNFPIRNRIIAGLSLGTLVIEAAQSSGSLLTATAALDYNREVFAIPGEIYSENSEGTNKLIKLGAKLVTSYKDILDELNFEEKKGFERVKKILPDSPEEDILLRLLGKPTFIDELVKKSSLNTAQVNAVLIQMELKGKVQNLGGTRYVINK